MNKFELSFEQLESLIFEARILKSDWLDEFYSLDEEAAKQEYNPCFKYTEQDLLLNIIK